MEQKAKGSENKLNGIEIAVSSTAMTRWAGNDMVGHYDKKKARSSRNRAFFYSTINLDLSAPHSGHL